MGGADRQQGQIYIVDELSALPEAGQEAGAQFGESGDVRVAAAAAAGNAAGISVTQNYSLTLETGDHAEDMNQRPCPDPGGALASEKRWRPWLLPGGASGLLPALWVPEHSGAGPRGSAGGGVFGLGVGWPHPAGRG